MYDEHRKRAELDRILEAITTGRENGGFDGLFLDKVRGAHPAELRDAIGMKDYYLSLELSQDTTGPELSDYVILDEGAHFMLTGISVDVPAFMATARPRIRLEDKTREKGLCRGPLDQITGDYLPVVNGFGRGVSNILTEPRPYMLPMIPRTILAASFKVDPATLPNRWAGRVDVLFTGWSINWRRF